MAPPRRARGGPVAGWLRVFHPAVRLSSAPLPSLPCREPGPAAVRYRDTVMMCHHRKPGHRADGPSPPTGYLPGSLGCSCHILYLIGFKNRSSLLAHGCGAISSPTRSAADHPPRMEAAALSFRGRAPLDSETSSRTGAVSYTNPRNGRRTTAGPKPSASVAEALERPQKKKVIRGARRAVAVSRASRWRRSSAVPTGSAAEVAARFMSYGRFRVGLTGLFSPALCSRFRPSTPSACSNAQSLVGADPSRSPWAAGAGAHLHLHRPGSRVAPRQPPSLAPCA